MGADVTPKSVLSVQAPWKQSTVRVSGSEYSVPRQPRTVVTTGTPAYSIPAPFGYGPLCTKIRLPSSRRTCTRASVTPCSWSCVPPSRWMLALAPTPRWFTAMNHGSEAGACSRRLSSSRMASRWGPAKSLAISPGTRVGTGVGNCRVGVGVQASAVCVWARACAVMRASWVVVALVLRRVMAK